MEFFWEMLSLQETMFLLILTGVLIKKLKIIDAAGRKMLSDLLIDVILPCNIVESFLGGMVFPDGFARNCLLAVGLSAVIQLMSIYGSKLLFRKYPREQRSVLSYGIICSNSSFVGLPVARLLFGDLGVIYTSMFQIPLRFTMWPAGIPVIRMQTLVSVVSRWSGLSSTHSRSGYRTSRRQVYHRTGFENMERMGASARIVPMTNMETGTVQLLTEATALSRKPGRDTGAAIRSSPAKTAMMQGWRTSLRKASFLLTLVKRDSPAVHMVKRSGIWNMDV